MKPYIGTPLVLVTVPINGVSIGVSVSMGISDLETLYCLDTENWDSLICGVSDKKLI